MSDLINDMLKRQQQLQKQFENIDQQQSTQQNRNVDAHVNAQTTNETTKTDQTKGDIKDTIQASAKLSTTFTQQSTASPAKPQLTPPTEGDLARTGRLQQPPQADKQMSDRANASNVMQSTSYQTILKAVQDKQIPTKDQIKNFANDVQKALSNPQKAEPEAKNVANDIIKEASQKLQEQGVSPDKAQAMIDEAIVGKTEVDDFQADTKFNSTFDEAMQKSVPQESQTLLTFAKDNPDFSKLLPDNLQETFNNLMDQATNETAKAYPNVDLPPKLVVKDDPLSKSVVSNYADKISDSYQKGDLSAQDATMLMRNKSPAVMEASLNEVLGGKPDQENLKEFLSKANDFIEKFKDNLDNASPPLDSELKKAAVDLLMNGQLGTAKTDVVKAFQNALPQDGQFSPEALRMADAYFNPKESGLASKDLPEGLRKDISAMEQSILKNMNQPQMVLETLQKGDNSPLIAMLQSLGTPVGPNAEKEKMTDAIALINAVTRLMKKEGISPEVQAAVLNSLKGSESPEEIKQLVDRLIKKVGPKVCSDRGLLEGDLKVDPQMIKDAEMYLSNPFNALSNNALIFSQDYSDQFVASCNDCSIDLSQGAAVQPGTTVTSAPSSDTQGNLTSLLNEPLSTISWNRIVSNATNNNNQSIVDSILSDTQLQNALQNAQRLASNQQYILSQEANTEQTDANNKESKHYLKPGPVGKFFRNVKKDIVRTFKVAVDLVIAPQRTIAELIKDPNQIWTESFGTAIKSDIQSDLKVVRDAIDVVLISVGFPPSFVKNSINPILKDIWDVTVLAASVIITLPLIMTGPLGMLAAGAIISLMDTGIIERIVNATNLPQSVKDKIDKILNITQKVVCQVVVMALVIAIYVAVFVALNAVGVGEAGGDEIEADMAQKGLRNADRSFRIGREVIESDSEGIADFNPLDEPTEPTEGPTDGGPTEEPPDGGEPTEGPATPTPTFNPTASSPDIEGEILGATDQLEQNLNNTKKELEKVTKQVKNSLDTLKDEEMNFELMIDETGELVQEEKPFTSDTGIAEKDLRKVTTDAQKKLETIKKVLSYITGGIGVVNSLTTSSSDIITGVNYMEASKIEKDLAVLKAEIAVLGDSIKSIINPAINANLADMKMAGDTLNYLYELQQQRFRQAIDELSGLTKYK